MLNLQEIFSRESFSNTRAQPEDVIEGWRPKVEGWWNPLIYSFLSFAWVSKAASDSSWVYIQQHSTVELNTNIVM